MSSETGLKTAAVYDLAHPYFTKCDLKKLFGKGCNNGKQGIMIHFCKELSRSLNESIKFIPATKYGLGGSTENQTAFKQLVDGTIDFLGPDYEFVDERQRLGPVISTPIVYTEIRVYFATRFTGTTYNIFEFANGGALGLIMFTAALFYLIHFFYRKWQLKISLKIGSGSTAGFLVTINVLLNLFSSRLSAKLTQSKEWKPRLQTLENLHKLVEMSSQVILVRNHPTTAAIERILLNGWSFKSVGSIKKKMVYVEDKEEALESVAKNSEAIAIASGVEQFLGLWKTMCSVLTSLAVSEDVLAARKNGFYFSLKSLNRTKKLRDHISKNHLTIAARYNDLITRYLSVSQKYWMCSEDRFYKPSVTLRNTWNTSLKNLLFGLVAAMGILMGENVFSRFINLFREWNRLLTMNY